MPEASLAPPALNSGQLCVSLEPEVLEFNALLLLAHFASPEAEAQEEGMACPGLAGSGWPHGMGIQGPGVRVAALSVPQALPPSVELRTARLCGPCRRAKHLPGAASCMLDLPSVSACTHETLAAWLPDGMTHMSADIATYLGAVALGEDVQVLLATPIPATLPPPPPPSPPVPCRAWSGPSLGTRMPLPASVLQLCCLETKTLLNHFVP